MTKTGSAKQHFIVVKHVKFIRNDHLEKKLIWQFPIANIPINRPLYLFVTLPVNYCALMLPAENCHPYDTNL